MPPTRRWPGPAFSQARSPLLQPNHHWSPVPRHGTGQAQLPTEAYSPKPRQDQLAPQQRHCQHQSGCSSFCPSRSSEGNPVRVQPLLNPLSTQTAALSASPGSGTKQPPVTKVPRQGPARRRCCRSTSEPWPPGPPGSQPANVCLISFPRLRDEDPPFYKGAAALSCALDPEMSPPPVGIAAVLGTH